METCRSILDRLPWALLEYDYMTLASLREDLERRTVTHVHQFLLEHPEAVLKTLRSVRLRSANRAAFELFGQSTLGDLCLAVLKVWTTSGRLGMTEQISSLLSGDREHEFEFRCVCARRSRDLRVRTRAVPEEKEDWSSVLMAVEDVTEWRRLERDLRRRSQLDSLTQLLNHKTIVQRLEEEISRARRYGLSFACMMIDLDDFKGINDRFGHQKGDQILKQVARQITRCVRRVDVVGRYGGDEFILIFPETRPDGAQVAARRILEAFEKRRFRCGGVSLRISLSIGISGFPSESGEIKAAKDLIVLVDRAMYAAKESGRGCVAGS